MNTNIEEKEIKVGGRVVDYLKGLDKWWPQPNIEKELLSQVASFQVPD